jgi:hypothetical protein
MKERMGARGGVQTTPSIDISSYMPPAGWLARCIARKTPIGYGIPTIMPFYSGGGYGGPYGKKSNSAHCEAIKVAIEQGKGQYKFRNIKRQEARFCEEARKEQQEYDALYGTGEEDAFQQQTDDLMRQFQEQQEQSQNGSASTGGGAGLMWPLVGLGVLASLGLVGVGIVGKRKKKKKKRKKR